ncbi:MAG: gliding motility-associated C-terminal domain-containing protein [Flavobacteriales bacterium]|nr:gliding motility-associated C-terminal domain-containing protein [Flavobacteriales bacterium]
MKNKKLTKYEQKIQDKLNEVSFDYQSSDWDALRTNIKPPSLWNAYKTQIVIGLILLVAAFTAANYIHKNQETRASNDIKKTIEKKPAIKNKSAKPIPIIKEKEVEEDSEPKAEIAVIDSTQNDENILEKDTIEQKSEIQQDIELTESKADSSKTTKAIEIESSELQSIEIQGFLCLGNEIEIKAIRDKIIKGEKFTWTVSGKTQPYTGASFAYEIEKEGLIEITCTNENSKVSESFTIKKLPEINFTYEDLKDPYWDEAVRLNASPSNLDYSWEIENLDDPILGNNQTVDMVNAGLYDVELIHITENGCVVRKNKPISIQSDFNPLAPNAFTPDGDGLNDNFMPQGFFQVPGSFKLSIHNANGNLIYETLSKEMPWNGQKNNQGISYDKGIFIWKVEIEHNERKKTFSGQVRIWPKE